MALGPCQQEIRASAVNPGSTRTGSGLPLQSPGFGCLCRYGGLCSLGRKHRFFIEIVAPVPPIFPEQFHRMRSPVSAISTAHGISRTVSIAAPANALRIRGMDGEQFFSHFGKSLDSVKARCHFIKGIYFVHHIICLFFLTFKRNFPCRLTLPLTWTFEIRHLCNVSKGCSAHLNVWRKASRFN